MSLIYMEGGRGRVLRNLEHVQRKDCHGNRILNNSGVEVGGGRWCGVV